jgi:hypothetical protein
MFIIYETIGFTEHLATILSNEREEHRTKYMDLRNEYRNYAINLIASLNKLFFLI